MSTVQVLSIQVFQSIWSDPSLSRGFYLLETIKLGKYFNQSTNKNCTVFLPWFGMFNIVKTPFIFSLSVNFISYVNNFSSQLFYLPSTYPVPTQYLPSTYPVPTQYLPSTHVYVFLIFMFVFLKSSILIWHICLKFARCRIEGIELWDYTYIRTSPPNHYRLFLLFPWTTTSFYLLCFSLKR